MKKHNSRNKFFVVDIPCFIIGNTLYYVGGRNIGKASLWSSRNFSRQDRELTTTGTTIGEIGTTRWTVVSKERFLSLTDGLRPRRYRDEIEHP